MPRAPLRRAGLWGGGEKPVTLEGARRSAPRDVGAVLRDGHAAHGSAMVIRMAARDDRDPPRVTIVASRKIGNAVTRNRAKRRLREAVRTLEFPPGCDAVIVARATALLTPLPALHAEASTLVRRVEPRLRAGADA